MCRASTGKRPPVKVILRKGKQCKNKERSGLPSKLIPKKSIFKETMKTLIQEQDHTEICQQICPGSSIQSNKPRDKEILKDKLDRIWWNFEESNYGGQVDSLESLEMPEITEKIENLIKVTKYLARLKEVLINCIWEKSHFKKHLRIKFSVDSRFSNELYGNKRKPWNAGNQQKAF